MSPATLVAAPVVPPIVVGAAADGDAVEAPPDLAAGDVVAGVVMGVVVAPPGGESHSAIVSPAQRVASTFRRRRHSLSSIDNDQRALIEIQSPA